MSGSDAVERRGDAGVSLGAGVFESALDAIVMIDSDGRVVDLNPAAERLFGYSRDQMLDAHLADRIVPDELRDAHRDGLARWRETGEGPVLNRLLELPAVTRDGRRIPVEVYITPTVIAGRPYFSAHMRDITARQQREQELKEARDAAEAASRFKSLFLASMSHELRTPMTAIVGYAELLLRRDTSEEDRGEWVRRLQRNADYLLSLVDDVLDLSKIEAGEARVERVETALPPIVSHVLALFRAAAEEKLLALAVTWDGPVPERVLTDALRLKQILVNLVGNAVKFTEDGGVEIRVAYEPGDPGELVVDVVDTGPGIDEEAIGGLFRPFSTVRDQPGRDGGTGLGLTICRHYARALGGEIEVESTPGRGSRFRLRLPAAAAPDAKWLDAPAPSIDSLARGYPIAPNLRGAAILIVDDNPDNQSILRHYLRATGAELTIACHGADALAAVEERARGFDAILMDMMMPVMDGYDATRRLRARGLTVPIVAVTAYAMADDEEKCLAAGCSAYLSKPIRPDDLYARLAELVAPRIEAPCGDDVIRSTMAGVEGFEEILGDYVARLAQSRAELIAGMEEGRPDRVRGIVHRLRGTGANFGFPELSRLAGGVEDAILASGRLPRSDQMSALLDHMERLRAAER